MNNEKYLASKNECLKLSLLTIIIFAGSVNGLGFVNEKAGTRIIPDSLMGEKQPQAYVGTAPLPCTSSPLKFANIDVSGYPNAGALELVDSSNTKVADITLTLPGTNTNILIRNSGLILTTSTYSGPSTNLANGFQQIVITPVPGGQLDSGWISLNAITSLTSFTGFNNFKSFTIDYSSNVSSSQLLQDTVGSNDFMDSVNPPAFLSPGTIYNTSKRGTLGIKYVSDTPGFLIRFNTLAISSNQSISIDFQKLDQGPYPNFAFEWHDYQFDLKGCVRLMPIVNLVKSCTMPANCATADQLPDTEISYKIDFSNDGSVPAQSLSIVDQIPTNTDFKIGSMASNPGTTGLTFTYSYSSDYDNSNPSAATWTYTPLSGGGGASAGFDRNVKAVRWSPTSGGLGHIVPNNSGSVSFTVKIR